MVSGGVPSVQMREAPQYCLAALMTRLNLTPTPPMTPEHSGTPLAAPPLLSKTSNLLRLFKDDFYHSTDRLIRYLHYLQKKTLFPKVLIRLAKIFKKVLKVLMADLKRKIVNRINTSLKGLI